MTRACPSDQCKNTPESEHLVRKFGKFYRSSDRKFVQRFVCVRCKQHFSAATFSPCYRQKKRFLNPIIERHLHSHVWERQIARILKISRTTVARKKKFLGIQAEFYNNKIRESIPRSEFSSLQLDDMITFEHTKLKQVSIPLLVTSPNRFIVGLRACEIPTTGVLAEKSRKKYPFRKNEHPETLRTILREVAHLVPSDVSVMSDEKPGYNPIVMSVFPEATHKRVKGLRGCVVGQGELKASSDDPMFALNHTAAMLRAHIAALVRRTWCTTKKIEALNWSLQIYAKYHNKELVRRGYLAAA